MFRARGPTIHFPPPGPFKTGRLFFASRLPAEMGEETILQSMDFRFLFLFTFTFFYDSQTPGLDTAQCWRPGVFFFSFQFCLIALTFFLIRSALGLIRPGVSTLASKPRVLRMTLKVRRNVSERNKGVKEKHPSARVL